LSTIAPMNESEAEDAQYVDQARRLDHYGERVGEQPVQGG